MKKIRKIQKFLEFWFLYKMIQESIFFVIDSNFPYFLLIIPPGLLINTMEKARVDAKMELEALGVCLGDSDDKIFNFDARLAFKLSESLEAPALLMMTLLNLMNVK